MTRRKKEQPEDKDQRLVQTPYGKGLVIRTRKSSSSSSSFPKTPPLQEVRLLDWESPWNSTPSRFKSHPTLYTIETLPTVQPQINDDVICLYGRGTITQIITTPTPRYIITLTSWRLANRSLVRCTLSLPSLQVVRKKTLLEMDPYERIAFAKQRKKSATPQFKSQNYQSALESYSGAVDAVRYIQHDTHSSNDMRADLVEIMVTCSNNAATCCGKLGRWKEASQFAQNALVLLDALYKKRGLKIHTILNGQGYSDSKLFGEWKAKSLIVMARAKAEEHGYEEALEMLKMAKGAIGEYGEEEVRSVQLVNLEREVKKLIGIYGQRKKAILKKEKLRAQAMFGGGSQKSLNAEEEEERMGDGEKKKEEEVVKSTENGYTNQTTKEHDDAEMETNVELEKVILPQSIERKIVPHKKFEAEPWYVEHKEALLLAGVGGLLAFSTALIRSFRK